MTHVCASASLSVLLTLRAPHPSFSYTHRLFQSCFDVCKCCGAGKPLECAHPRSSDGTYPAMTPPAVTSEILHRGANHSAHPSTYPAATGFPPSHPPVSNRAEVGREVYPAVTRPRGGDPYPSGPRPVVGGLRWGRVYSHKSSRPGLTLSGS